ncbi:MAG: OmpA family protein [Pseudomonadota bacterium]
MTLTGKFLIIALTLGLGACTSADRFGTDGPGPDASMGEFGDPTDPTSQAFFMDTIGDRVLFEVDQATLTPTAETILAAQAQWLMANPAFTAVVEGHADERGTREYNLGLSDRRAAAARTYLVAQGVAPNRVMTVFFGKERPVEICSVESCFAANRRAVTVLRAGPGV